MLDVMLLDRIRSVTVQNHPGALVKIVCRLSGRTLEVTWATFVNEYALAGWDLA